MSKRAQLLSISVCVTLDSPLIFWSFSTDCVDMISHILTQLLCLVCVCSARPQPGESHPAGNDTTGAWKSPSPSFPSSCSLWRFYTHEPDCRSKSDKVESDFYSNASQLWTHMRAHTRSFLHICSRNQRLEPRVWSLLSLLQVVENNKIILFIILNGFQPRFFSQATHATPKTKNENTSKIPALKIAL